MRVGKRHANRIIPTREAHSGGIHLFVVNYERARLVYSARYDKYVGEKKRIGCILFAGALSRSLDSVAHRYICDKCDLARFDASKTRLRRYALASIREGTGESKLKEEVNLSGNRPFRLIP